MIVAAAAKVRLPLLSIGGQVILRGERRAAVLSAKNEALLREVVSKYLPDDAERLLGESPEQWLSPLRRRVRDAVGEELAKTGFDAHCEPTSRGEILEALIDFLNRIEFASKSK